MRTAQEESIIVPAIERLYFLKTRRKVSQKTQTQVWDITAHQQNHSYPLQLAIKCIKTVIQAFQKKQVLDTELSRPFFRCYHYLVSGCITVFHFSDLTSQLETFYSEIPCHAYKRN